MAIRDSLLAELDQELASARRLLEAVPPDRAGYRPHEKSWTLGELSLHVASVLTWQIFTLERDEVDLADPTFSPPAFESVQANLRTFDANAAAARAALELASDEHLKRPWTLRRQGQVMFTMPRLACLRSFVLNHLIHHRGQLTVYLRMCDVPLPPIYGPTADVPGSVLAQQHGPGG